MKPPVQDLLERINLELVHEAIMATGIKPWDVDSIVERVLLAADLWLLDDLKSGKILVEQEYDLVSKGIMDLVLIHDKDGATGIVDWKTTGNLKRPNYIEEVKSDFQTVLYLAHGGDWLEREHGVRPQYIEYRALDEAGEYRSVRVQASSSDHDNADNQVWSVQSAYQGLINDPIWPRNKPRACFIGSKVGPTCPYYSDCSNLTMPRGVGEGSFFDLRPRSKSSMKSFMECPEKYRRTKLLGDVGASSDAIKAGEAFHSGIESIYVQVLAL